MVSLLTFSRKRLTICKNCMGDIFEMEKYFPASECVICEKTIDEAGGRRIIAQHLRGISLSKKYQGGGNTNSPRRSFSLNEENSLFMVVWGDIWTDESINRALQEFHSSRHPWFCQICGKRTCFECKYPINMPVGSDCIYENGSTSHCPI